MFRENDRFSQPSARPDVGFRFRQSIGNAGSLEIVEMVRQFPDEALLMPGGAAELRQPPLEAFDECGARHVVFP